MLPKNLHIFNGRREAKDLTDKLLRLFYFSPFFAQIFLYILVYLSFEKYHVALLNLTSTNTRCPIIIVRSVHLSYYSGSGNNSATTFILKNLLVQKKTRVSLEKIVKLLRKGRKKNKHKYE